MSRQNGRRSVSSSNCATRFRFSKSACNFTRPKAQKSCAPSYLPAQKCGWISSCMISRTRSQGPSKLARTISVLAGQLLHTETREKPSLKFWMSFTPDCHVERSRHIPGSTHRNATGFLDFASLGMTENLFARLGVYQDDSACSAAMNMAIDEALLEYATFPSIRFYRWHSPALSFGYFGRFSDVADHASARDVVRRWTRGGIVFHGDDLTYSIVIPVSDAVCNESS